MSMILVRTDLHEDPRVTRVALACKTAVPVVVGALVMLWSRAQTQSKAGFLAFESRETVDARAHLQGFAEALESVEWLCVDGDGVRIPDFAKYHGKSAKVRQQNRLRKARERWGKSKCKKASRSRHGRVTVERDKPVTTTSTGSDRIGSDRIGSDRIGSDPHALPPTPPGGATEERALSEPDLTDLIASQVQMGQDSRARIAPKAAPMPQDRSAPPSGGYPPGWDRNAAIRAIVAAYPLANGATKPAAVKHALYALGGTSGEARFRSEAAAGEWLLGRVRAWASSRLCASTPQRFRPALATWLRDECFDADDAAWAGEWQADGAGKAADDTPAHLREFIDAAKASGGEA